MPTKRGRAPLTRHARILDDLGGYMYLAEQLGLEVETVRSWRKRNRGIPPRYWHRIAALCPDYTPDYLARTGPRPKPRKLAA